MNNFETIEKELRGIIHQLEDILPEYTIKDTKDLIKNREYGIALEIICEQLYEIEASINQNLFEELKKLAHLMEMPSSTYDFLELNKEI